MMIAGCLTLDPPEWWVCALSLALGAENSTDPVILNGRTYKVSRLADDTHRIVYKVDVLP